MTKNLTLLASVLGTWTAQWTMKDNSFNVSFVAHFLPDPMRGYGCEEGCHEWENEFCYQNQCLSNGKIPWSDVAAFYYFEATILDKTRNDTQLPWTWTTGEWVGPYSVVFAHVNSSSTTTATSSSSSSSTDRYSTRYVKSPITTTFLQSPWNASFTDQFETYMGKASVDQTFAIQTNHSKDSNDDPAFNNSCNGGSVRPALPLMEFSFMKNPDDGSDYVIAQLDYKIFLMPHTEDPIYNLLPEYEQFDNYSHILKGPYCYQSDPNGAFALDVSSSNTGAGQSSTNSVKLIHGCVQGLACFPPAAAISPNANLTPSSSSHQHHGTYRTNSSFHSSMIMTCACYLLAIALMISIAFNRQQQKRHNVLLRRLRELHEEEVARIGGRYLLQESAGCCDVAYTALGQPPTREQQQQQQQQEPLLPTCEEGSEGDTDREELLRFHESI